MLNKILIVGHGSAGKRHLQIAKILLPNSDIRVYNYKACRNLSNSANGFFTKTVDVIRYSPNVAIIANPAPFHLKISKILAKIGCHLMIEKPLSSNLKGVKNLLQIAKRKKIVLQVGYNMRFLKSLKRFMELIRSRNIGKILSFNSEVGQDLLTWRPGINYRKSVSARADLGGGVLLELSHELDYARWIFGDIKWASAWYGKLGNLKIDVEDSARLVFGFKSKIMVPGGVGSIALDCVRKNPTRFCLAIGSDGSLRWDGLNGNIARFDSKQNCWKVIYQAKESRNQSYINEWKSFISSVRTRAQPQVSGDDGIAVLQILEAIKKSNKQQGKRIRISTIGLK